MPGKNTIDIGSNLTRLREEQNLSMDELVNAMNERGYNWTKTTLYKIEHGERRLLAIETYDLLASLGLDPLKDMPLLYRKTSPTLKEEADRKLWIYAEQLSSAWNAFREAVGMHARIIDYEEAHSNITSDQAQASLDMASSIEDSFSQNVQERKKSTLTSTEIHLHDFPIPPASNSPNSESGNWT